MLVIGSPYAFDFQQWLQKGVGRETPSSVKLPFNIVPAGYAEIEHMFDSDTMVPLRPDKRKCAQRRVASPARELHKIEIGEVARASEMLSKGLNNGSSYGQ